MDRTALLIAVTLLAACGADRASLIDAGADASRTADGAITVDATPPDASTVGTCVLTLSNLVGSNAVNTTIAFPYMAVAGKGETCNSATPPTSCSTGATDSGTQTAWSIFQQPDSFADGTTMPIIADIATQPGTAIVTYLEGQRRWAGTSGTFTIDHQQGNQMSFHATAQLAADTTHTLATGTFQLDVACAQVDLRP